MAIENEIEDVIQRHVANAVAEVADLLKARVAGAIGIENGRTREHPTRKTPKGRPATVARVAKKRTPGGGVTCIAPNCNKTSKGPRFHFLCDNHRTAPKAKWTAWAAAAKKKKA
jgi:hypothetical protein